MSSPTPEWDAISAALSALPDDDDRHPLSVLGRWTLMLAEDWGHELPPQLDLEFCTAYLDRNLSRLANDPEQDWPLFAAEVRKVHSHLEGVLHNSRQPERGAPCPDCRKDGHVVRLRRQYPHWCEDAECTQQFHFTTDEADVWQCPRNKDHWWTQQGYADLLKERQGA